MKNEPEKKEDEEKPKAPPTYRQRIEAVIAGFGHSVSLEGRTYGIVEELALCIVDEMDRKRRSEVQINGMNIVHDELQLMVKQGMSSPGQLRYPAHKKG